MDCPYIIRETIDADHVREHGYYQLDELVYDMTHVFASADVEVISRPVYNVIMESGERLSDVDDETVFKMLSAGLPVLHVENARDGYIMYSRPEPKPAVKVKKVGGITRANNFMVVQTIHEAHDDVSYVEEGLTEKAAKELLSLTPEEATLYAEDIGVLCKVSVFEKNGRGEYIEVGRKCY